MTRQSTGGFRVSFNDTSLFDLVQIECTRRAHGAARIDSEGRRGYLYFDGGDIVHARTGALVGERALFEMLSWPSGEITPANVPWPAQPTLQEGWEHLLLRAAQELDETPTKRLSSVPPRLETGVVHITSRESEQRRSAVNLAAVPQPMEEDTMIPYDNDWAERTDVFDLAKLDAGGQSQSSKGDGESIAQLGAYVVQLAERIGDELGLDGFEYLIARTKSAQMAIAREGDGVLAFRADSRADIETALKARDA